MVTKLQSAAYETTKPVTKFMYSTVTMHTTLITTYIFQIIHTRATYITTRFADI